MAYDYLMPLEEKNRDEYFLVEADGFLVPTIDILLNQLRLSPRNLRDQLPKLSALDTIPFDEFYNDYSHYTKRDFVNYIFDRELPDDEYQELIESIENINVSGLFHTTIFGFALLQLLEKKFFKALYVKFDKFPIPSFITQYMMRLFSSFLDNGDERIHLIGGDILKFIEDHPELTTIALNSTEEALTLADNDEKYHLVNTMILLRASSENTKIEPSSLDPDIPTLKYIYEDTFTEKTKNKAHRFIYFPVGAIDMDTDDEDIKPIG